MTTASTTITRAALLLCLTAAPPAAAQGLGIDIGETVESTVESLGSAASDIGETVGGAVDDAVDRLDEDGSAGDILELFEDAAGRRAIQPLGQDRVLEAVRARRAIPLENMLDLAGAVVDDEVIDARLVEVRGFLLYEIKVIGAQGDVRQLYFYARSGLPVR